MTEALRSIGKDCLKISIDYFCDALFPQYEITNNTTSKRRQVCWESCEKLRNFTCKEHGLHYLNIFMDKVKEHENKALSKYQDLLSCKHMPKTSPDVASSCYFPKSILQNEFQKPLTGECYTDSGIRYRGHINTTMSDAWIGERLLRTISLG